jgi:hypothetical protein
MSDTAHSDREEDAVLGVVLLLIAALCLGFSFYAMMVGYRDLVGSLIGSGVLALILVLMLFALNYKLRRGLLSGMGGGSVAVLMTLYLVVVLASFSGMFNKFYSTFMHDELIKEELQQKISAVQSLKERAVAELTSEEAEKLRAQVESKIIQLSTQIQNPQEPGRGPKAQLILIDIEKLLGVKITDIGGRDSTSIGLKKMADSYAEMIRGLLERNKKMVELNEPERRAYVGILTKDSKTIIDRLTESLRAVNSKTEVARSDALLTLQDSVNLYKGVGSKTRSLIKDKKFEYDEAIRVENDEIGKISHTYRSAIAHINHWAVWVAAFLALMIDLIVPLFVYFLTPRGRALTNTRQARAEIRTKHTSVTWDQKTLGEK